MAKPSNNFGPIALSALLHALLLAAMVAAYDFARPVPITPMAIQATLVTEVPNLPPLPVVEKEPEPEPVVEEPEPEPEPEPDNSEELRREAEEKKRIEDALIEKQRLEELQKQKEEAERKEKERAEAERKQKERDEAERKKQEEERKEREREEAERKRLEDVERQRQENERRRKEMEDEQRSFEIEAEERRLAAESSPAMDAYRFAIAQKIRRNWSVPASAAPDTLCTVRVRQIAGGEIIGVNIVSCNGDEAVKRSVEAAVQRSSPLPQPSDPDLFRAILELNLRPETQN